MFSQVFPRKIWLLLTLLHLISFHTAPALQISKDKQECAFACAQNPTSERCACLQGIPVTKELLELFRWKRDVDRRAHESMFRWGKREEPDLNHVTADGEFAGEVARRGSDQMFRWGKRDDGNDIDQYEKRARKPSGSMFRWGKRDLQVNGLEADKRGAQMFRWGKRASDDAIDSELETDEKRSGQSMFRWGKRAANRAHRKDLIDRRRIFMWGKRSVAPGQQGADDAWQAHGGQGDYIYRRKKRETLEQTV